MRAGDAVDRELETVAGPGNRSTVVPVAPRTVSGTYLESADDPHVARRRAMLDGRPLRAPDCPPEAVAVDGDVTPLAAVLRRQLGRYGLGLVTLDEPLASPDFIELGERLGELMPETDPAVQPNVEMGRILHLVSAEGNTADVLRQPFGTGALSLHSEGSGRPASQQPRYVVLMCVHPGDDENAAQTVLVPFASVDEHLGTVEREVLDHLRYARPGVPTVRSSVANRPVFSFRDFQADALHWVCEEDRFGSREVRGALVALLQAMYHEADARALRWRRGLLAVIDNTWWFHGRSAAPFAGSTRHRHLKRLRITSSEWKAM